MPLQSVYITTDEVWVRYRTGYVVTVCERANQLKKKKGHDLGVKLTRKNKNENECERCPLITPVKSEHVAVEREDNGVTTFSCRLTDSLLNSLLGEDLRLIIEREDDQTDGRNSQRSRLPQACNLHFILTNLTCQHDREAEQRCHELPQVPVFAHLFDHLSIQMLSSPPSTSMEKSYQIKAYDFEMQLPFKTHCHTHNFVRMAVID